MTDEQLTEFYNNLVNEYRDNLPNPEHEPIQFAHIVKLYKYYNLTDHSSPKETVYY